jgi:endonuclease-3 related protein
MKELFEGSLERDPVLYNEFHALIVKVGIEHCKAKAKCAGCPLENRLPRRDDAQGVLDAGRVARA